MNKQELCNAVAEKCRPGDFASHAACVRAVSAVFDSIAEAMQNSEQLMIVGFGAFKPVLREEREARNPATGEIVTVPAHRVVKFTPSRTLNQKL